MHKPSHFILDEPTSAMDMNSEQTDNNEDDGNISTANETASPYAINQSVANNEPPKKKKKWKKERYQ